MDIIESYLRQLTLEDYPSIESDKITYNLYCLALEKIAHSDVTTDFLCEAGQFNRIKDFKITSGLTRFFKDVKSTFVKIGKDFKLGMGDIINAFKDKSVFSLLKSFKFNLKLMLKSLMSITTLVRQGLLGIFTELSNTVMFQQLKKGTIKIDTVLDKYPLLKKLIGPAIAGLLLYMWLNMTFIGDVDYDFDFSDLAGALAGSFSVAALFSSPEGLMLIALFGTGAFAGISFPWLGKSTYNLIMAILYTSFTKSKDKKTADKFKRKMKFFRLKK